MKGNRVRFNVGGKKFETTATTLATAGRDSFFGPLLSNHWNTSAAANEYDDVVFIDRDPECFAVILNLLRTGELSIPPHVGKDSLIREAQFYGVLELVRVASWVSHLNIDLALPSSSITCRAPPSAFTKIFGSPNGGFCVANDTSVHVYDWTLHQNLAIHLGNNEYGKLNDALWVGTNNIAISTKETVGMFDAATGKLKYKFVDEKGNQVSGATSMCRSDSNVFHLYQSKYKMAIGILDCELGKSTDRLYFELDYNPKNVWRSINLQTVDGGSGKCLLAMYAIPRPDHYNGYFEAQIIDTRDVHSVYNRSWSSRDYNQSIRNQRILGGTLMEDRNSICVMSDDCSIGILDLRFTGDVQWCSEKLEGCMSRKLMYHNDRIFMLSSKGLLVYSVPDLVMTSNIPGVGFDGNPIFRVEDFSISGERLFILQSRTNVVDVWETPRPCLSFF